MCIDACCTVEFCVLVTLCAVGELFVNFWMKFPAVILIQNESITRHKLW